MTSSRKSAPPYTSLTQGRTSREMRLSGKRLRSSLIAGTDITASPTQFVPRIRTLSMLAVSISIWGSCRCSTADHFTESTILGDVRRLDRHHQRHSGIPGNLDRILLGGQQALCSGRTRFFPAGPPIANAGCEMVPVEARSDDLEPEGCHIAFIPARVADSSHEEYRGADSSGSCAAAEPLRIWNNGLDPLLTVKYSCQRMDTPDYLVHR